MLACANATAQDPEFFELDLTDLESAQEAFPRWLEDVTETGGSFSEESGWLVGEGRPFGMGQLFLTLNPNQLNEDLALTIASSPNGEFAVQLLDAQERVLAVDLLGSQLRHGDFGQIVSLAVPLKQFPTAKHIVLRRLSGEVAVNYVSLLPLTEPAEQTDASLRSLAALLGDPQSPDNPLLAGVQTAQGTTSADLETWTSRPWQPLYSLATKSSKDPITEAELLSIFQVLGLQGYAFNAYDFVRAAGEGRQEVVSLYLRAGMPIDVQGDNKYTALAEAATSGELRVIELLCDRGADMEIRTAGGNTPLWMACLNLKHEAIRLLVEKGAKVNAICVRRETPAHILIDSRYDDKERALMSLEFLMDNGADSSIVDDRGRNIVTFTAQRGWTNEMKQVLRSEADLNQVDEYGMTAVKWAKYRGNSSMARLLVEAGAEDWNAEFDTPEDELVYLLYRRRYSDALKVAEAGADVNCKDMRGSPIAFRVALKQDTDYFDKFVALGMDITVNDYRGECLLRSQNSGYKLGRERIVEHLLKLGLDPNKAKWDDLKKKHPYQTPLMGAAGRGNVSRCRMLLEYGANPTVKNLPRRTAAMIAERNGHYQLARELRAAEETWRATHPESEG